MAGNRALRKTVAKRVFDDWLENEVWDRRVERARLDVEARGETILKAHALDFEIALEKLKLLLKLDFLRA